VKNVEVSRHGVTFVNAQLSAGKTSTLRFVGQQISALGEAPLAGDIVVDLHGDRLLPGLINAHDHLQLNSLPPLESHDHYRHVREWIDDINGRRRSDPDFENLVVASRDQRLLIGGVKNLLSGVTTVAHHDPLYSLLFRTDYPVSIVVESGWSHSLYIDGEESVRRSYESTPSKWPWIIHAAEGLDDEARSEFDRLDAMNCLKANTLLVHGIALDRTQRARLDEAASGLIWCPSSNLRLFGKTANVSALIARGRVALGTDSRLSGSRDLLDELRIAGETGDLDDSILLSLVTAASARLLRLGDRGVLKVGARADLLVLPAKAKLFATSRADVRLVLHGGKVKYGDLDYAQSVSPRSNWAQIQVDGAPKILDTEIAAQLSSAGPSEDGVRLSQTIWRAA
jgi:cytosine/adenosine deaminase-related metal-dependent hydrolase